MITEICYPVPLDSDEVWAAFKPFVERFARTWREFEPGCDCRLVAVCCVNEPNAEVKELFHDLQMEFVHYPGRGCDIGAAQYLALQHGSDFQVNMTSRCYLYQTGWLAKIVSARQAIGSTLYGTSASREGGKLHICTRAYSLDAEMLRCYPHTIESRDQGTFFEVGSGNPDGSLTDWVSSLGLTPMVVTTSGIVEAVNYHTVANRFRNGDQSEMLLWDRHTDLYRDASPEGKQALERLAEGLLA